MIRCLAAAVRTASSSSSSSCARRPARALALPLAFALAFAATSPARTQSPQAGPVRLGVVAPLTGPSADFGNSVAQGAALAADEVNAAGGVIGRRLELVLKDDRGEPGAGRAAAQALVADPGVAATVGYCNTGVALKALDVFEAAGRVLVIPCAQGTVLTRRVPAADSMVFRVAPADVLTAGFLVGEIVDRRHLARVAILADETGYGDSGLADFGVELKKHGLAPAYVGRFAPDAGSLRDELEAARAAGAQALVVYTVGPGEAVAVRGRAAMHWDVPYFAPWTLSFRSVLDNAGAQALEGTMMTQSLIQDAGNAARTSFIVAFSHRYPHQPIGSLMAAAQAYDSVQLLVRALFATAGDASGPALKNALEDPREPYRGVVTTYDRPFSMHDHEAFSRNMIWLGVWRGGEIRYFYPEDARLSGAVRRKQ